MFNQLKLIPLITAAAFGLQACGDDDPRTADAPKQVIEVNSTVYSSLRQTPSINQLFNAMGATNNDGLCNVKVHRMKYNTIGGSGEAATSSGVFMLPQGDSTQCSGERPVLLYAHGTTDNKGFDLSQFIPAPGSIPNASANEGMLLLAAYASRGYAVIAPNYAGYSDSSLSYHPYLDRTQQTTEMMNALDHVRENANTLGAKLSSKLFISGLSQGGYVALATHKALEDSGETVTASMPVSGPYAMLDFIDRIFEGDVNDFATVFAPLALTALDKSGDGIYDDPSEVYASAYAGSAESALPNAGGFAAAGLPVALFSGTAPASATNQNGFGANHLLSDAFRAAYRADIANAQPANKVRVALKSLDLRDAAPWAPKAPVLLCAADNDTVVYYENTEDMVEYWNNFPVALPTGLIQTLNLNATPAGPFADAQRAFANAGLPAGSVHGNTGLYCAGAGFGFFSIVGAPQTAVVTAASN